MAAIRPLGVALLALAAAPALPAAPVPADTAGRPPTVSLYVRPVDRVLADVRTAANMIARFAPSEKEAKEFTEGIDPGLEKAFGADWKKGIDTTRPLGGYGTLDEDLPASTGVLMVPVRDEA